MSLVHFGFFTKHSLMIIFDTLSGYMLVFVIKFILQFVNMFAVLVKRAVLHATEAQALACCPLEGHTPSICEECLVYRSNVVKMIIAAFSYLMKF